MAWVSTTEIHPQLEATRSADGREYTRSFIVKYDSAEATNCAAAITASGVPSYNSAFPLAVTGEVTPRVVEIKSSIYDRNSQLSVLVEVRYSNDREELAAVEAEQDELSVAPWNEAPKYSYSFIEYTRAALKSAGSPSLPIVNSVGDLFDPQPEESYVHRKITISLNTPSFNPSDARFVWGSMNADAGRINGELFNARECRLLSWNAQTAEYTDPNTQISQPYYQHTIEIEVSPESYGGSFSLRLINQGYRYKDGEGKVVRAMDESGTRPVSTPVLLNTDGTRADPTTVDMDDVTLTFQIHEEKTWAGKLPSTAWVT